MSHNLSHIFLIEIYSYTYSLFPLDLNKLLQMGDMVKNLPEPALKLFKWQEYARALVTSIGFDANTWVKSPEEAQQEEMARMEQQMAMQQQSQTQGNIANTLSQGVAGSLGQMAAQDLQTTGGQGIQQVLEQNPELAEQVGQISGGLI